MIETKKIIVDTREQMKLWYANTISKKLDEGDYSVEGLEDHLVIERKSPGDLYTTLTRDHNRFKREILRSIAKKKHFIVYVECSKEDFLTWKWSPRKMWANPSSLDAMMQTMEKRYNFKFIWCSNREIMRELIKEKLKEHYLLIYAQEILL